MAMAPRRGGAGTATPVELVGHTTCDGYISYFALSVLPPDLYVGNNVLAGAATSSTSGAVH